MEKAWLSEIFDSIQGEGIYLGVRQIFLRFAGCNLRCNYCDTPESLARRKWCKIKGTGYGEIENPLSVSNVIETIKKIFLPKIQYPTSRRYHSISLTGGEPLLQVDFIKRLIPYLKKMGLKIYLETNGTLPDVLKEILDDVDFIAMDIKLPSSTGQEFWKEHKEFLKQCAMNCTATMSDKKMGAVPIFVKIVVTPGTTEEEIRRASELIAETDRNIPLVLQPESKSIIEGRYSNISKIRKWLGRKSSLSPFLGDVRVIPQIHKILGLL